MLDYIPYSKTVETLIKELCDIYDHTLVFIDGNKFFHVFEDRNVDNIPADMLDWSVKNYIFDYSKNENLARLLLEV